MSKKKHGKTSGGIQAAELKCVYDEVIKRSYK